MSLAYPYSEKMDVHFFVFRLIITLAQTEQTLASCSTCTDLPVVEYLDRTETTTFSAAVLHVSLISVASCVPWVNLSKSSVNFTYTNYIIGIQISTVWQKNNFFKNIILLL